MRSELSLTLKKKNLSFQCPPFDGVICLVGALVTMNTTQRPMSIDDKVSR